MRPRFSQEVGRVSDIMGETLIFIHMLFSLEENHDFLVLILL